MDPRTVDLFGVLASNFRIVALCGGLQFCASKDLNFAAVLAGLAAVRCVMCAQGREVWYSI